jgi:pimeloyl-ACP methyl ester carboxylesterase
MRKSGWQRTTSTPVPQPTTVNTLAADLNALLTASGEPGPYVLVGHSLGGAVVRLYASAYPAKVAGLVLDDALSEDLGDGLTPEQLADFQALNSPAIQGRPSRSETIDYTRFVEQMRAAPPFPAVPMIILTADRFSITPEAVASGALPPFVTQAFADALWSSQLVAQDKLAARYPGAQHITKTNATHYIHNDNPRLVVDSIRDVVQLARTG